MNFQSGSNHKAAATWNRQLVLRVLGKHGQLSRRRLADMIGLRGSTLTYIVREFLDRQILSIAGKADSQGVGPRQVLLELNANLGWAVGLVLRPDRTRMVLYDAAGHRLRAKNIGPIREIESLPRSVAEALSQWRGEMPTLPGRMLGLGIGVPGVVDTEQGVVLNSKLFHARQIPLKTMLHEQFADATIVVDHDARLGAVAEATEGAGKFLRNFLYFIINPHWDGAEAHFHSFGAALYLDERVYRGAHFAAGELDETLTPSGDFVLRAEDVDAWGTPQAPLTEALDRFSQTLQRPLASLVNLLDVPRVVLGGDVQIANEAFLKHLAGGINALLIPGPRRTAEVVPSPLEGEAVARGAALSAVDEALAELCDRS